MEIKIKRLHENAIIPKYATIGSAGFDFHSVDDIIIYPGETALVKTGLSFEIPINYELQVRPRSGMSLKTKLRVSNSPGTVDSDYRGEICIIMDNIDIKSDHRIPYEIKKGDRIAQGIICPIIQVVFEEVNELNKTERNTGAFGSTGN
jgi:dUTP pyrophosphatase